MKCVRPGLFMLMLGLMGCGEGPFDPEVGEDIDVEDQCGAEDSDPDTVVTFEMVRAQVFEPRCNCHTITGGLGQVVGRLNLANYDTTLAGGLRSGTDAVIEGDPCNSQLWQKLTDIPPFGARMPFDGTRLTPQQQQMVVDWIADGAQP